MIQKHEHQQSIQSFLKRSVNPYFKPKNATDCCLILHSLCVINSLNNPFLFMSFMRQLNKDIVYIGNDFPDEYAGSNDTARLQGTLAKAKANATQGLPELIQIATEAHRAQHDFACAQVPCDRQTRPHVIYTNPVLSFNTMCYNHMDRIQ